MSNILVNIPTINGECRQSGHTDEIECFSMSHAMDLPVVTMGAGRTGGVSRHGAIHLMHTVDKATPNLRHACSAGTNLGEVTIYRMQMIGGSMQVAEKLTLKNTYVVRMEMETPVDPSTKKPSEEPMETFALEYSEINWNHSHFVDGSPQGTVSGGWSATDKVAV